MRYKVNDRFLEYTCDQEKYIGDDSIALLNAIDLTAKTDWHKKGFSIEKIFEYDNHGDFTQRIRAQLVSLWKACGLPIDDLFPPNQYHTLVNNQETHLKVIAKTKELQISEFPINIQILEQRISTLLDQDLIALNPFDGQRIYHYRIIRPLSRDNNPLHCDVWLEDYDDCINLYIPIDGSNEFSSLIISPGSHLWPESKIERTKTGAIIDGQKFNVPAVTGIFGKAEFERPNPQDGEVLIFSPYLIHGGAINLNKDLTRVSLEIRLWKR